MPTNHPIWLRHKLKPTTTTTEKESERNMNTRKPPKTITLYSKTTGCQQCAMTKTLMVKTGLAQWDSSASSPEVISAIPGLEIKTIHIDDHTNTDLVEDLKAEGLLQAPIIMLSFPVTGEDGIEFDTWSGFLPDHIKATAKTLGAQK